jgi:hypothetical protein
MPITLRHGEKGNGRDNSTDTAVENRSPSRPPQDRADAAARLREGEPSCSRPVCQPLPHLPGCASGHDSESVRAPLARLAQRAMRANSAAGPGSITAQMCRAIRTCWAR